MLIQVPMRNVTCPFFLKPWTGIPSRVRSFVFGDNIRELVATSIGTIVIQGVDNYNSPEQRGHLISQFQLQAFTFQARFNPIWYLVKMFFGNYSTLIMACTFYIFALMSNAPSKFRSMFKTRQIKVLRYHRSENCSSLQLSSCQVQTNCNANFEICC